MQENKNVLGDIYKKIADRMEKWSFQYILSLSFSCVAFFASILVGIFFNYNYSKQLNDAFREETGAIIEQVNISLYTVLRSMMKASDSLYYNLIKDMSFPEESVYEEFQLIYETNQEFIDSIALFKEDGILVEAAPASVLSGRVDVTGQKWFQEALKEPENQHFSAPKVQNLFQSGTDQYNWVIPISREVWFTYDNENIQGVLVINLRYSCLDNIFNNISIGDDGYIYLIDGSGEILYHPMHQLIFSGMVSENNIEISSYPDGTYLKEAEGKEGLATIKTLGYTGWKIVGVTKNGGNTVSSIKSRLFMMFIFVLVSGFLILINTFVSNRIYIPIRNLENSVQKIEKGDLDTKIKISGGYELRHLGEAIQRMTVQMKKLMEDIVAEHELKRKSELDALQSQINPHFLYNTLDIIVWMIENEQHKEAVKIVTALARLFRISLSKGKMVIPLNDEMEHVRNYLVIQQVRFKNRFTYVLEVSEEAGGLTSLKLIIQPLVENAVYHGMEYMCGDGQIKIQAAKEKDNLVIRVEDNGLGMTPEKVRDLLNGKITESGRQGSGIGVKNVQERIRLYFGADFGLDIWSEPDEGTVITVKMPSIPYSDYKEEEK